MQKGKWTRLKKSLTVMLCFTMVFGLYGGMSSFNTADAAVNVGANPTPVVDIAVNVPSDYPGTFLDFKQELTEKLIEQGMEPGTFRITDTAVKIDTTDLNGWYVYDHYYNKAKYDALNLSEEQKLKQPMRLSNDSSETATEVNIENYFKNGKVPNTVYRYNHHVMSYEKVKDGRKTANMAFVGYATPAYSDFMMYPATSDSRRTISFDLDAKVLNKHTLTGGGFLLNAGIVDNKIYGYIMLYGDLNGSNEPTTLSIYKVNGLDPVTSLTPAYTATKVASVSASLGSQKKARITVELKKDTVTIQQQNYGANNVLGSATNIMKDQSIPQLIEGETLNGFGPFVGYASHGCAALSMFQYTDLEMSYESTAFDALKTAQYYQGAEYKYFVNLAGTSNDPNVPIENDPAYGDGINLMNENEIFYISNADDGRVLTETEKDEDGDVTHQGLGTENGFIASGDDYAGLIAQYIYTNYTEGVKFKKAEVTSSLPLANFYMKDVNSGEQIMTIHLQHLVHNNATVAVNIVDKSMPGTMAGENGSIAQWRYKVYDPKNAVVYDSSWVDSVSKINDYIFDKNSTSGRYTFELSVKDNNGNESKVAQTYLVAFLDDEMPIITGANSAMNQATITLTDTGMGIDEDGITFIEDGRGSGVEAYWVTRDEHAVPTEKDWITLDTISHTHSFDVDINDTEPIVVWVRDECGNQGAKAVFQPTRVVVKGPDGEDLYEYYVIGEKPIIVLPEEGDIPNKPDDDDEHFSGWTTEGGDPITPGTDTPTGDDHTIVIKPNYSKEFVSLIYLANEGQFDDKSTIFTDSKVVENSSILTKVNAFDNEPTRVGYTFKGWKLLDTEDEANAANKDYINNASHVSDVTTQQAIKFNEDRTQVIRNRYYLVAQWEVGNYKLKFDANGGSLGNVRSIEDVAYNTNIGTLPIPTNGRGLPTKAGSIFQGWSESSANDVTKMFKAADGIGGTLVAAPTMPASDKTIYAVWKADTSKFVVSFDTDGGNKISDQEYVKASATSYATFLTPTKPGYKFEGWYVKNDDGTLGDTKYAGGETIAADMKKDHTFVATWSAKSDTKYTVDYFINSGNKDSEGNYIYTKVNDAGVTKTYTGTTEDSVAVKDADKIAELQVGGESYWYNPNNEKNILSGVISGSPTLSLRLYYDRYFDVNASKTGNGNVTGAQKQKEGSKPTVSWKAGKDSYVSRVVVDGVIRDDLLDKNTYTYPDGIHEDHKIYVEFTENSKKPGQIGGDKEDFYEVRTAVVGCSDPTKYEITPTTNVKAGGDHKVTWEVNDSRCRIVKVEVDGIVYNAKDNSVDFSGIKSNHSVIVTIEVLSSIGGGTSEGQYTVTVNRYGGDENVSVSPTMNVNKGDSAKVEWDTGNSEYSIYKILVDGKEISLTNRQKVTGSYSLNKIAKNHVVDIYMAKPSSEGKDPEPPVLSDDKYIQLTTQLIGAPGTITGGAVIEANSNYDVEWSVKNNGTDPDSDDYVYYEVESVVVDNQKVTPDSNGSIKLNNIQKDTNVEVYVKPKMHNVTIKKYGEGTVSASRVLYHLQNYRNITAQAADGWTIARIVIDGEESYLNPDLATPIAVASKEAQPMKKASAMRAAVPTAVSDEGIMPLADTNTPDINDIEGIVEDHVIEVYFTTVNDDSGKPDPLPDLESLHEVNVQVQGGPATINKGLEMVKDNGNVDVNWSFDSDIYEIEEITVNGQKVTSWDAENSKLSLSGITEDKNVVIKLKKKPLEDNDVVKPGDFRKTTHTITAIIKGANGQILGSGQVDDGADRDISWTYEKGTEIQYIFVNGKAYDNIKEAQAAGGLTLSNITDDQTVVVVVGKPGEPPVNVDKDDDGRPDINIDKDGDGKPDVNVDTDGDGNPDINVDTDNDNKPDINIDTDGDGKPDVNVDTDGDNKPDINIDTNGDGKPDINIDTNGDGKPDINVDTNGDGKADINIDTDGDGKPDVNIDTDGDGIADKNIDADGDGIPDHLQVVIPDNAKTPKTGDSGFGMHIWTLLGSFIMMMILGLMRKREESTEE